MGCNIAEMPPGNFSSCKHVTQSVICIPQVFQTFLVSFNEQRRPIMPLLTAMRRTQKVSDEQRALREAWDALTEKVSLS